MIYGIYRPEKTPAIPLGETLRYAGMPKCTDEQLITIAKDAVSSCEEKMKPVVVYRIFKITAIENDSVILDNGTCLTGSLVSKYLSSCVQVCIMVGTVGLAVDRMISACSHKSGVEGLFADAAGSAAIEAVMDDICHHISKKYRCKPRISPGYGDFPLTNQSVIFSMLDATKNIGTCLNDSLLISPSKSVSALVGLFGENYV